MKAFPVTITKPHSDCGNWTLLQDGPLRVGSELDVDLDSRAVRKFKGANGEFECETVAMIHPGEPKILLPVSMLDID